MQKRGTFNEKPAARMLFCLAEPFFEPAAQVGPTCLYTILSIRTPISTAVGEKSYIHKYIYIYTHVYVYNLMNQFKRANGTAN